MRRTLLIFLAVVTAMALPSVASAATGVSIVGPNGSTIIAPDEDNADPVVASWNLAPGWKTVGIEWSHRPETRYAGGPFLFKSGGEEGYLSTPDTSAEISLYGSSGYVAYGPVYWHVKVRTVSTTEDCTEYTSECVTEEWSDTASFTVAKPPVPVGPPVAPKPRQPTNAEIAAKHPTKLTTGPYKWRPSEPLYLRHKPSRFGFWGASNAESSMLLKFHWTQWTRTTAIGKGYSKALHGYVGENGRLVFENYKIRLRLSRTKLCGNRYEFTRVTYTTKFGSSYRKIPHAC